METMMAETQALEVTAKDFDVARHDATVTLVSPRTGDHRTFKISTIHDGDLAGARMVSLLTGPDHWTGFAFVSDGRHGTTCPMGTVCVWKRMRGEESGKPSIYERYADLLNRASTWAARGVSYQFSLKCRRCSRELTTPGSLATGYGPICWEKVQAGI